MENPIFDSESRENSLTWEFQRFFHIFTPSPRKMTSKLAQNTKNYILMKWVAENLQGGSVLTIYIRYQYEVRYDLCAEIYL